MSLLIDALKRAERAKSGQAEPQLSTPNSIERAVSNAANPIDWQLADALPEPKVRNTPSDLADTATSRPEPQLGDGMLRSEIPRGKPAAAKVGDSAIAPSQPKSASTNKSTGTTTTAAEREAAKTLFAAKRPAPRNRAGILAAGGLAALLLAGGGFYVWYSLAFPPGPAIQPLQARAPLPAAQSSVVAPIAATAPTASAPPESALPAAAQPPSLAATGVTEPTATPSTKSKPAHNGTRRSAMRTDNLSTEETVRREVEQAQRRKSTTSRRTSNERDGVRFDRGERRSATIDPDLAQAYEALLSGNRGEAKRLYNIALDRDPFSVDALLGLATIAGNQGNMDGAEQLYQRALELDPQNAAALAGLSSVRHQGGPSESQLKFELARSPDSATLHFALGNQYANQGRWNEAQQAYFDAFSLDGRNADYAYNLAVSLDQIGQAKQAKVYYRRALELAANYPARFSAAAIKTRLAELAQAK